MGTLLRSSEGVWRGVGDVLGWAGSLGSGSPPSQRHVWMMLPYVPVRDTEAVTSNRGELKIGWRRRGGQKCVTPYQHLYCLQLRV